jgi:hypothetical protein
MSAKSYEYTREAVSRTGSFQLIARIEDIIDQVVWALFGAAVCAGSAAFPSPTNSHYDEALPVADSAFARFRARFPRRTEPRADDWGATPAGETPLTGEAVAVSVDPRITLCPHGGCEVPVGEWCGAGGLVHPERVVAAQAMAALA